MSKIKDLNFSLLLCSYFLLMSVAWLSLLGNDHSVVIEVSLLELSSLSFNFVFVIDKISVSFSMIVTFISSMVFMFSHKYMEGDYFSSRFIWILLLFVVSMNFLIFSGSILFLLLGWDGLGITSFALIIYYESKESQFCGFQTLMINRVGDALIVMSVCYFVVNGQFTYCFMSDKMFYSSGVVLMLGIASLTKSAQFPFSSWLPAAMAAPTPVSALVHSSTLVTAGIFLVVRLSYNLSLGTNICNMLLFCGSMTCLLGSWSANYENDIKKIIALSTLSQLGVMVFSLGMNLPNLSLLHLYTHALFKALLFLAAGHILLSSYGVQDVRMMGGVGVMMPFTCITFNISSFCLVGAPFMSSFYSKHVILEKMFMCPINLLSILIMMLATFMTSKYVFRSLKLISWGKSEICLLLSCNNVYTFLPVIILSVGAIGGGKLFNLLEMSNMELGFLPSLEGNMINIIVIGGVVSGAMSSSKKGSWWLSSLFFLTPVVYGSLKPYSMMSMAVKLGENGWVEPLYYIKNYFYVLSMTIMSESSWPGSRLLLSCLFVSFSLLYGMSGM